MILFTNTNLNPSNSSGRIFSFYSFPVLVLILLLSAANLYPQAKINFNELKKNFGSVKRGEIITLNYTGTNSGNAALIIQHAEVSCSCTQVDFPKQPIAPQQGFTITIQFNTATVYGRQDREAIITSNGSNEPIGLRYKGTVSKK